MHEPVVEGLEEYLAGTARGERLAAMERHLAGCPACRAEVEAMRAHQEVLRALRSPEPLGPAAGFYARVRERIEARRAASIWSLFLQPAFSRRLSFASLVLPVVLGVAAWQSPAEPVMGEGNPMAVFAIELPEAPGVDPGHDRAVVLTHLVGTGGAGDELPSLPVSSD
jgi:anti-sigma factor RsiW